MLVEPDCDEGAVRVEIMSWVLEELWSGLLPGRRMVSTQPFASAHVLAGPACGKGSESGLHPMN